MRIEAEIFDKIDILNREILSLEDYLDAGNHTTQWDDYTKTRIFALQQEVCLLKWVLEPEGS